MAGIEALGEACSANRRAAATKCARGSVASMASRCGHFGAAIFPPCLAAILPKVRALSLDVFRLYAKP